MKEIYERHDEREWKLGFERFKRKWERIYPDIIRSWERDLDKLMVYLKYPYPLRRFIYTTNALERFIKEVKRRVKVIEVFPSEGSVDKIVYLVVEEMNEKYRSRRLKNFERIIEELRGERRARYGSGEIKIITNEKEFYTQKS
ncbi:transposase [Caldimicrobium thiodismutans]|uniref:Mutator family transposase n=1 Tax=Caldimicrobium thiodismutans TaxID=1653476 RepID=A0A0U5AJD6_9BACT|nr:transposase [Caldimicrobium thiodismutans]BAU24019.1 transposase [Caldimicrobium thiodismutans]